MLISVEFNVNRALSLQWIRWWVIIRMSEIEDRKFKELDELLEHVDLGELSCSQ